MAEGSHKRARSSASADQLYDVLVQYATSTTFIQYDESKKVQDAKLHTNLIKQLHPILADIHKIDGNFNINKKEAADNSNDE